MIISGKRNKVQIIKDILDAIQQRGDKIKPTHIMYRANLTNKMLHEYLHELMRKELIVGKDAKNDRKTYALTDKGHQFLADYQVIERFMASYGLVSDEEDV